MRNQDHNFLKEHIRGLSDDACYGIATVQPDRKKCRIRNLTVEYLLDKSEIVLFCPKACNRCERKDACTDEFALKILEKYNEEHQDSDNYRIVRRSFAPKS